MFQARFALPHRLARRLLLPAALTALAAIATPSMAQVTDWEFFVPRDREFSHTRKVKQTMELHFGGRTVDPRRGWSHLSEEDRATVRSIQPALAGADEPPYPKAGLAPLIERLHRVRGPQNETLRMFFEIDELGEVSGMGAGAKVSQDFLGQMVSLMISSGFKPGTCEGNPCKRVFVFDMRYVGP